MGVIVGIINTPATRRPTRLPRAFTLIELLVVISIIGLLIGILLPTLGRARDSARDVKCLANLKGIGVGVRLYVDRSEVLPDVLPLTSPDGNANDPALLEVLADFVDVPLPEREDPNDPSSAWEVDDPWKCPADTSSEDAASNFQPVWQTFGTSYDYVAGRFIFASEVFELFPDVSRATIQRSITRGLERRDWPLLVDAGEWHAGGVGRNSLYFPDMRADELVEVTISEFQMFLEEIVPRR